MATGFSTPAWFNPTSQYGGSYKPGTGAGSFAQSPAGTQYFNRDPGVWYDRATLPFSSGNDPFSQFVRSRQQMFERGYDAAQGTNPFLTVPQYGKQNPLSEAFFRAMFMHQPAQLRGQSYSNIGGGRIRYLGG